MKMLRLHQCARCLAACLCVCMSLAAAAQQHPAHDTLATQPDKQPAAAEVLANLTYTPGPFAVERGKPVAGEDCDLVLSFDSPKPGGDDIIDRVSLQWYAAKDEQGGIATAPAVVVVHSVHPEMIVGRAIARGLRERGIHAFVVELPGFGRRVDRSGNRKAVTALTHAPQGIADVRRARDAVAALPEVARDDISLAGVSMGGFFAIDAAAMDGAFARVFILLAGGDVYGVLRHGEQDAAYVRQAMLMAGYDDAEMRALAETIEPLKLAHRLDAQRTWLVAGVDDRVVPFDNCRRFAEAVGLDDQHFVRMNSDHYSALLMMPGVVRMMADVVEGE